VPQKTQAFLIRLVGQLQGRRREDLGKINDWECQKGHHSRALGVSGCRPGGGGARALLEGSVKGRSLEGGRGRSWVLPMSFAV